MDQYLEEDIIDYVKTEFETGQYFEGGFEEFLDEEGYDEETKEEALDFYYTLRGYGPAGMLEEYPDLDWDEDYIAEYGDPDEDF